MMNINKKAYLCMLMLTLVTLAAPMLSGCDDGYVAESVANEDVEYYNAKITGTFKSLNTWTGSYSVAAACFVEGNDYSVYQKVLPASSTDISTDTLVLSGIPTEATSIEIAVVNNLRKRVATLYTYSIDQKQRTDDTISIELGTLDVGMFGAINKVIFQDNSCSRCHGANSPRANLDLTVENAYSSLVNVKAAHDSTQTRVTPGNADSSYLYKVITDGAGIRYSHPSLFTEDIHHNFIEIIRTWINSGAKE